MFLPRLYLLLALICSCPAAHAADPTPQPSFYERVTHPDRSQKSAYQGKAFNPGGGDFSKTLKTGEYAGVKDFDSKPFLTRTFEGAKKSWMGQFLFHEKKLPENLQGVNGDASKQFGSKEIPLKNYGDLDKKSSLAGKEDFATRQIKPKGASQGAIDNDQHLQEQIKKGLSIDDVRKLLNKPQ
jgi:hypothetical protein